MKIKCACGEFIPDQTDYLPNKAHIIGDKNYLDFLDEIDDAIEHTGTNRVDLCMKVRGAMPSRFAWECSTCGRLYLEDAGNSLIEYLPKNRKPNRIFDRTREKSSS